MISDEARALAHVLWEFHQIGQTAQPADVIIALGTNDDRVATWAAELYHQGFGRKLVCTGGVAHTDDLLATSWGVPEAEHFAGIVKAAGVPADDILLEPHATNTAENFRFSRRVLAARGLEPRSIVIAVKPFMQRRAWATLAVEWPEIAATVSSPPLTFEQYCTGALTEERILHILMGDLQRLWVYGRKGWSAVHPIPADVRAAFERLRELGFTRHLIGED